MDFLAPFRNRFEPNASDEWFESRLRHTVTREYPPTADIGELIVRFSKFWEQQYEPTVESIRIARWIYGIARGVALARYSDPIAYDARWSRPDNATNVFGIGGDEERDDDVPIYAIDGLPGSGKTALRRALPRLLPGPQLVSAEGDPPTQILLISAIYIEASKHPSLSRFMKNLLVQFGADEKKIKQLKTIDDMAAELKRLLYRHGVVLLIVDELQWITNKKGSKAATDWLMELRKLGVPIVFFANTDLLLNLEQAPTQVAHRIVRDRETLGPILRGDPKYLKILEMQFGGLPFGHTFDLPRSAVNLYDMWVGSPRASGRLLEVALALTAESRTPVTKEHLQEAYLSPRYTLVRIHLDLLKGTAAIDLKKRPELSSANTASRALKEYIDAINRQKLSQAAALTLLAEMTDKEREAMQATEISILRESGELPSNVYGIGEAPTPRTATTKALPAVSNSAFAKKLAAHAPKNPTNAGPKPE